jgi:hypothetical protein
MCKKLDIKVNSYKLITISYVQKVRHKSYMQKDMKVTSRKLMTTSYVAKFTHKS